MDGSDSITNCDHCICNFDVGEIYEVDGEHLCGLCRNEREAEDAKDNGGWISVHDDLPKGGYKYLPLNLVINGRTVIQGGYHVDEYWCEGVIIHDVTHFQPLPSPPIGKT